MHQTSEPPDPVAWAASVGFTCEPWQAAMLRATGKLQLWNCARMSGKSTATALLAAYTAIHQPNSFVLVIAPSMRLATEMRARIAGTLRTIPLDNGSSIECVSGDSIVPGGSPVPALVIIDEAATVGEETVQEARTSAGPHGAFVMISTPVPHRRGAFYRAWHDTIEPWARTTVPASECKRFSASMLDEARRIDPQHFAADFECKFV